MRNESNSDKESDDADDVPDKAQSKRNEKRKPMYQLTLDIICLIDRQMKSLKLSPYGLAKRMADNGGGPSDRTIELWRGRWKQDAINGKPHDVQEDHLVAVFRMLNIPMPTSVSRGMKSVLEWSFPELESVFAKIDFDVQELTKSLYNLTSERVVAAYKDHLRAGLDKYGLNLESVLEILNNPSHAKRLSATCPQPDVTVEVADDFSFVHFMTTSGDKLKVSNPKLLWDCSCYNNPSAKHTCAIHSQNEAPLIDAVISSAQFEMLWRGVRLRYRYYPSLFPPSVDAFMMFKDLENTSASESEVESVLDLGSGTGALAIALAAKNKSIQRVHLSDWLLLPALYGTVNIARNLLERTQPIEFEIHVGMFLDWLTVAKKPKAQYDVVLSNPPYLPLLPGFESLGAHAVVAGTELLEYIIEHDPLLGKHVFVQYSHLAGQQASAARDRSKHDLRAVGPERSVPYRVLRALQDKPEYLNALRSMKGGLIESSEPGHRYWHKIQTHEVTGSR